MLRSSVSAAFSVQEPGNALSGNDRYSHADFKRWYAGIGKTIASNTHTLESVKATVLGGGRYQADIVGNWQAESKKGEYIVFKFRQHWTLLDGPGKQPLIQTYLVEAAN